MEIKTAAVDVVPARGAPKRSYAHLWEAVRNARTGAWTEIVCDDLIELHRVQSAARGNRTLNEADEFLRDVRDNLTGDSK